MGVGVEGQESDVKMRSLLCQRCLEMIVIFLFCVSLKD